MHSWRPLLSQAPVTLLALTLLGCASGHSTSGQNGNADTPAILPDASVEGRIVTVNVPLRYVVVDFDLRQQPALGQQLAVYRQGVRVGEVKITGPIMGTAAAGDIVAGQAAVGDRVRED